MLLWCTREVGYLRLPDTLVQTSSIMPQKRNPVPLEHARALGSKALGQALAIPVTIHNTPFGDIVDTEDDLQPLVASMFRDATRALGLTVLALREAQFDAARMRERATCGWVTVTELADTLAREHGLPFRTAHGIATTVVRASVPLTDAAGGPPSAAGGSSIADLIVVASTRLAGREIRMTEDELAHVLSPEHFIAVRKTLGGPAPEVVAEAIDLSGRALHDDRARIEAVRARLADADARTRAAAAAL
jgi:argininosuccinate lyase